MLELGPGSGEQAAGWSMPDRSHTARPHSLTGQYLTGQKRIAVPSERRPAGPQWLRIRGATLHNLHGRGRGHPAGHAHRGHRRRPARARARCSMT